MIPIDDARALLERALEASAPFARRSAGASERRPLDEALGGVLAVDVRTDGPVPPFARATMDGYAVRREDAGGHRPLRIAGEAAAGRPFRGRLEPGACVRIFTGAPVPVGTYCVWPQEIVRAESDEARLVGPPPSGRNIARAGENLQSGSLALPAGTRIGPGEALLLAALGRTEVEVRSPPVVAIVVTGDEVVDPAERLLPPGCVRDANGPALAALARLEGARVFAPFRVGDDPGAIERAVRRALDVSDVVFVTGGSSVGEHDHTHEVFARLGARVLFDRVAMKPGKPTIAALAGDRLLFGLPGNPIGAAVAFALFAAPVFARWRADGEVLEFEARLARPVGRHPKRELVLPARIEAGAASLAVVPLPFAGSGDVTALRGAGAFVRIPAGAGEAEADSPVRAVRIARPGPNWPVAGVRESGEPAT